MTDAAKERFEDVYVRLEEAVKQLEDGGLSLDDSIVAYEEGMVLARRCRDLLEDAELRIARLRDGITEGMDTS